MIEPNQSEAPGSRFRGYRGKLVGVGVAVAAFLAWYEPTRNQAIVLICDIAKLSGQDKRFAICEPEEIKDPLKKIENLKTLEKEGSLSSEQSTLLARLERHFIAKTFEQLARQSGVGGVAADERARADTRKAVTETVKIGDPQERAALAKIEDGNIKGGLKLLSELASAATRESVKQWRRVGRIAYSVDIATALDAYERVVAMDISNPWDAVYLSRLYVQSGALDPARRTAERALDRLAPEEARDRMVLSGELGNILVAQGDLDAALTRYRASLVIAEDLARDDPGNAVWRRDLSVSHEKVGDVHRAQGDLDAALTRYRASLSIAEDLARDDPGNAGWRRDLLVSHIKVGEVHRAQGDLDAALTRYRAALAIAEDLARDDPGNAGWRRDLSGSHEKVGDVHLDQGDLDDALTRYRASLVIREDLARDDPGNAKWRRDLWVSHEKVGDVHLKRGDLDDALTRYQAALAIAEDLARDDPGNAGWRRDLSISHDKIGNVHAAQGDLDDALTRYRASLAIREGLARDDPGNAGWRRDLAVSHWKLARNGDEPRHHLPEVVRILEALAAEGRLAPPDRGRLDDARQRLAGLE